ncbi:MAG TPA: hypothetical protein VH684_17530 [Xanthobacteraceae bacterium]|jgi:hypothetical protein
MDLVRIAVPLGLACACLIAAFVVVPHGMNAQALLYAQDDPARLADVRLAGAFDAAAASREIEAALAVSDIDLANSFVGLAHDRGIAVDPGLNMRVEAANSRSAAAARASKGFARGLITGEPDDLASFAGTALGDAFVFGDIRDAVREGVRLARGEPADKLILGLAGVGIAITAGTYASLGAGAPARLGLTMAKAARRTGSMTARMGEWLGRSVSEVVDWTAMRNVFGGNSLIRPVMAVRAARETIKVEKAEELFRAAGDVGTVQAKAGTQAAMDGLKIAEGPRDLSRLARLAEASGNRTRAIIKILGRSALFLGTSAVSLFAWLTSAVLTILGFFAACKRTAERLTESYLRRRKGGLGAPRNILATRYARGCAP